MTTKKIGLIAGEGKMPVYIAQIEAEKPCPEVQHLLDFCKNSARGIVAAKRSMRENDD